MRSQDLLGEPVSSLQELLYEQRILGFFPPSSLSDFTVAW